MADLSKIRLNNTNYNLKDKQVRDFLEKGWIPAGMESVYFDEQPLYDNCAILVAKDENNIETFFYSKDNGEWGGVNNFYSLDGQKIILDTNSHIYYYNNGIDNTKIYSGMEGFPNIYCGYTLPTEIGTIVIEKENNEYQFSSDQENFDWWSIITSGYDPIAIVSMQKTLWKITVFDNNNALPVLYYSYVDYENHLIHFTSLPQPNGIVYQLTINNQNEISLTTTNIHEPEDDEDVDDMLESLDLTVIDDDNLVGSAEIGSGNVVDWSTPKQTKGGVYIVPMTIIEHYAPEVPHDYTEGALGATWQDIFDNLINNGKQIFFYNESDNNYAALGGIGQDTTNNHYYVFTANVEFFTDTPNGYPQFTMS